MVSNATTLETLDIAISNIEGPISNVESGKLCNLQDLYLTQNKLNGDISRVVEGLSNCSNTTLEFLGLAGNWLTGQFPNSLGHLKNLRILSISFNQISGTIPTSIEQLSRLHQLKFLAISCGERFSVNLSSEWIPPFSLTYIEIRKCAFGSKLPTWLKTQKQLHTNILSNGSVSDSIPPGLWTMCSQLQFLDLSDNEIGGNLPRLVNFPSSQIWTADFYSSYSDGVVVDLSSNSFHGLLPLWPNVTHLNLANNLFSGLIPINIGHVMTKLQVLDLSGNTFTGSIPYSITRVKQLMRLDLSDNHFSGKIPDWSVSLGHSEFILEPIIRKNSRGHRSMQQLETLDLSSNHLSGSIPLSMTSITTLSYLNLSYNNLGGPIPSKNQFGTFTNPSSFECNPELSGKPLITDCSPPRKRDLKKIEEEDDDERLWF
ncbi:receptor-like protein EIX2 [Solanum stenotomum]|uniref:receptor-like protein EIX2 n=1 Tax=Solanum stenotomum TaxID=172797 RepID=UPI0020D0E3BB|nr:receptor-like protein EIX2 [Solanum stenotomum]